MGIRVLHVISALGGGGAETQLKLLAQGLAARGWEPGVVYLYDDPSFTERSGITCIQLERGKKQNLTGLASRIREAAREFKPDIIHVWLPEVMTVPAAFYARRHGIPCLSAQRYSMRRASSFKGLIRGWLGVVAHLLSDRVVTNFRWDKDPWLVRKIMEERDGKVIRNGISLSSAPRASQPQWLRADAFKVFFVGRLVEQKRADLLIQAVANLRKKGCDVQLGIYGKGVQEESLRELARTCGLGDEDIRFLGYRPDWQTEAPYYDLFVLPSMVEGMPNALIEAMGMGVPTLASDIYEVSTLVDDGVNSVLVKPGSLESLTDGIGRLIADPQLRSSLVSNGRALVQELSTEHMIDAYVAVYRQMLAAAGRDLKGAE